jgi:hypothetical protein
VDTVNTTQVLEHMPGTYLVPLVGGIGDTMRKKQQLLH